MFCIDADSMDNRDLLLKSLLDGGGYGVVFAKNADKLKGRSECGGIVGILTRILSSFPVFFLLLCDIFH